MKINRRGIKTSNNIFDLQSEQYKSLKNRTIFKYFRYCLNDSDTGIIKVAISEFGLSILMLILLNHYNLHFFKSCVICMIISGLEANKTHFMTLLCLQTKLNGSF